MLKLFFGITAIVWILSLVLSIQGLVYSSRVDSWLARAQAAGNPAQAAEFLGEYKSSLHEAKMDDKYACIFRYPGCYVPTYLRVVDGLIERASVLSSQSPNDTSYQMGLVNLEKDLKGLESVAWGVWFTEGGWIKVWSAWLLWLIPFVLLLKLIVNCIESN